MVSQEELALRRRMRHQRFLERFAAALEHAQESQPERMLTTNDIVKIHIRLLYAHVETSKRILKGRDS